MQNGLHRVVAVVFVVAVVIFCGGGGWAATQQSDSNATAEQFERKFTLNSGGTLDVKNYKGVIHIEGTQANDATVSVAKHYEGPESDRERWLKETRVDFDNSADRVSVRVTYPTCYGFCNHVGGGEVDLTIKVPRQTKLEIDGYKPEMRISNIAADIRIKSYKSPIVLNSTAGAVDISTYKDTVRLENVDLRGLRLETYKGDVSVDAANLSNNADISTYKGDVTVRLPENARFNVDVDAGRHTTFDSDFKVESANYRSGEHIHGAVNGGGPELRLHSTHGTFRLTKRASAQGAGGL
jgi:hypothetical protein